MCVCVLLVSFILLYNQLILFLFDAGLAAQISIKYRAKSTSERETEREQRT